MAVPPTPVSAPWPRSRTPARLTTPRRPWAHGWAAAQATSWPPAEWPTSTGGWAEVGVAAHRADGGSDVVGGAGPPTAGHAGTAVLDCGGGVPGVGEGLGLAAGVGPVVLGAPEAAVHDDHREAPGDPVGQAHVVDLGGVVAVGRGARRRAGHLVEHLAGVAVVGHAPILVHSCPSAPGHRGDRLRDMQKWEYATVPLIVHATKQILDQWGEDGWELVQVLTGPDGNGLVAYLKREKA